VRTAGADFISAAPAFIFLPHPRAAQRRSLPRLLFEDAMDIDMKKHARLASLGAMAVAGALVALYAFVAWGSSPSPTGGMDGVHAAIAYIGAGIPILAIIAVHVAYSRQLAAYAKEHASDKG